MVDGGRERVTRRTATEADCRVLWCLNHIPESPLIMNCHSYTHAPYMESRTRSVIYKISNFLLGKFHQASETQERPPVCLIYLCACLYGGECVALLGIHSTVGL